MLYFFCQTFNISVEIVQLFGFALDSGIIQWCQVSKSDFYVGIKPLPPF